MKGKMRFTEGPWRFVQQFGRIESGEGTGRIKIRQKNRLIIAFISGGNTEESVANAYLIATAPELFNALKSIVPLLPEDVQMKVQALINKAVP